MDQQELRKFEKYISTILSPRHRNAKLELVDPIIQPIIRDSIDSLFTHNPNGLLLMGSIGCGKTSILAIVVKEYTGRYLEENPMPLHYYLEQHIRIRFVTHAELINNLRYYNKDTDNGRMVIPEGFQKRILLLDDLGRGFDDRAGWNLSLQEEYFDYRWKFNYPTFITTNLTHSELRSWPNWQRIVDRIADPNWITSVIVPGGSKRSTENIKSQEGIKNV